MGDWRNYEDGTGRSWRRRSDSEPWYERRERIGRRVDDIVVPARSARADDDPNRKRKPNKRQRERVEESIRQAQAAIDALPI